MLEENLVVAQQKSNSKLLAGCLLMLALLLNQSKVIAQVNLSFADFFMALLVVLLFFRWQLFLPKRISLFFLVVIIVTLATATLWVPLKFAVQASSLSILANVVKLVTVFLYFLVGYSVTKIGQLDLLLKWFAWGATGIAILAVLYSLIPGLPLKQALYFGDTRFSGLMNDPNYFSVLQCSALVYFLFNQHLHSLVRWGADLVLVFSILVSGSKTGLLTLAAIMLGKIIEWGIIRPGGRLKKVTSLVGLVGLVGLVLVFWTNLPLLVGLISRYVPEFERVAVLFTNFGDALHAEGSTRDLAWGNAVKLMQSSPLVGIGVGTYSYLAEHFYGTKVIAHNTYLQLLVEWGIPLASFSFGYLCWLMGKSFQKIKSLRAQPWVNLMIIPFLIGSFALSLNNARIFWVLFGAVYYYVERSRSQVSAFEGQIKNVR